jgi:hypothetical protein
MRETVSRARVLIEGCVVSAPYGDRHEGHVAVYTAERLRRREGIESNMQKVVLLILFTLGSITAGHCEEKSLGNWDM